MLERDSGPLAVSVVGLSAAATAAVLDWLLDGQPAPRELTADRSVTFEINAARAGWGVARGNNAAVSCIRPGDWHDIHALVAGSADILLDDPGAYRQFCAHGQVLIAASDSEPPGEDERSLLGDLSEVFEAVWPVVTGTAEESLPGEWPGQAVLRSHAGLMEPLRPGGKGDSADFMADPADVLRQSLFFTRGYREVTGAVDSLAGRCQREMKHLTVRQENLDDRRKTLGSELQQARTTTAGGSRTACGGD